MKHFALRTLVALFLGNPAFSEDTPKLASIRIVAGYPGGTDMPANENRVATLT